MYYVPDALKTKEGGEISPKSAQHIQSPFSPLAVLSRDDIIRDFHKDVVSPCRQPEQCHLNVNGFLFKNLGPFIPTYTCLDEPMVSKVTGIDKFGFCPDSLAKHLTLENILLHQKKDEKLSNILDSIDSQQQPSNYLVEKGILMKSFKNRINAIVVPKSLVPFVICSYHFMTHVGYEKLLHLIQMKYFWPNMSADIKDFCKGCVLCSIFKSTNQGMTVVGTPRLVLAPRACWQIDIVSGLTNVQGQKSFLTMIDMYTGFVIAVPLKNENTSEIAKIIENYIIKVFGPPKEISSDNAANLTGIEMRTLCKFYNIFYRNTVPYSPTSHALVEIANRYLVQLCRIFADQFNSNWVNVLTLSTLIYNSVPRPQLSNHSPFFMMFQSEPFAENELNKQKLDNMDVETFLQNSINDQVYAKILRERILKIREKRNSAKNHTYKSYPKGSLILVKDMRPKVHRKLKPVYYKIPRLVVQEYQCTVYASNFQGQIQKISKNNIKMANPRSSELFSVLPDEIKILLGDHFDEQKWKEIRESGLVPEYFLDIELEAYAGITTRGKLAEDTHLLEQEKPEVPNTPAIEVEENDELFDELLQDDVADKINHLHEQGLLTDTNLRLSDIPQLYRRAGSPQVESRVDNLVPEVDELDQEEVVYDVPHNRPRDTAAVSVENILPENQKRRRNVRFNLPKNS